MKQSLKGFVSVSAVISTPGALYFFSLKVGVRCIVKQSLKGSVSVSAVVLTHVPALESSAFFFFLFFFRLEYVVKESLKNFCVGVCEVMTMRQS